MSRWLPATNPANLTEVKSWAEAAARPLRRRDRLMISLVVAAGTTSAMLLSPILLWVTLALASMMWLALEELRSEARNENKVWEACRLSYGEQVREGEPGLIEGKMLSVATISSSRVELFAVGIGIWRVKAGRWHQAGWIGRPQWFSSSHQAAMFAERLKEEQL